MAAQVDPLGSLASGMLQTQQASAVSSSSKSPQARSAESRPKAEDQQDAGISGEGLETAAKRVADYLQKSSSDLEFGVDKDTGQYYFKVINPETHETIRQVPTEEMLAMAKRLRELGDSKNASGVLMDEQG